ncbi:hypothetical protein BAC1_00125 [uncultured bacterium]|nr:hypothetical protein BAC1_00125 [uncultured bacterium]
MERILTGVNGNALLMQALMVVIFAVMAVTIAYGVETVAPGVHDAFHDFRHVIGMPCH